MSDEPQYGIGKLSDGGTIAAPELPYLPRDPKRYNPGIGLIGCGGISEYHLREYQKAGYRVLALCDAVRERAEKRRTEFFPGAEVTTDYRRVLERDDIEVIDAATHPRERAAIIEEAIACQKHVLSQKPFVLDLDDGERLIREADQAGVQLAVNQNGRWAPHFSYIREAIHQGLLGDVSSVFFTLGWDHGWTADTDFNKIKHLLLYDFAIHWFDIIHCFLPGRIAKSVFASIERTATQRPDPPMLAQATIQFDGAQASVVLNGDVRFGQQDRTYVAGTRGTAISIGQDLMQQEVMLELESGRCAPALQGSWFTNGFRGTMGELLCSIEEGRAPNNHARDNLVSLALCFAAVASAESGKPVVPGEVRRLPGG
ncbi:MAG: gfo/Idh/MocA family oxidoreductase [bacterium]|nr:gfo/Idh/MocA family oxidoreductase [bacterium]